MKNSHKIISTLILAALILGGCIGGYFIWRHHDLYIGSQRALGNVLKEAGLKVSDVFDVEIDFEREKGRTWYEVEFESGGAEYEYKVDAADGSILSARTE